MHADPEFDTLGPHLLDAPIDVIFLHLEIRDAVAQQSSDTVILLEQHDIVTGSTELLRAGHAGGA